MGERRVPGRRPFSHSVGVWEVGGGDRRDDGCGRRTESFTLSHHGCSCARSKRFCVPSLPVARRTVSREEEGRGGSRQSSNALLTTGCAPRGERKYSTVVDCRRWVVSDAQRQTWGNHGFARRENKMRGTNHLPGTQNTGRGGRRYTRARTSRVDVKCQSLRV